MNNIKKLLLIILPIFLFVNKLWGQERPNILWLVIEDASSYLLPAYGNKIVETPNIDYLVSRGVVFDNAFSGGPQCSPARSALISGCDATTYGNDIHRQGRPVPEQLYFFPTWMREAGYFCVNKGKMDYNINKELENRLEGFVWDQNGQGASYNSLKRGDKPFLAQFNNYSTHMSRLTTVNEENRAPSRVSIKLEDIPGHVPKLDAIKADYELHLEGIEDADKWVGIFLDDLKRRELAENTIIFLFSDNGGSLPRGKGYSFNTGSRSALIVYVPQKWQHIWDEQPGTHTDRKVTFTDFGPTALSIAGVKSPEHMQGKPFMGKYRQSPRKYAFSYKANQGNHFDPSRSVYDGKYHYIRFYTPYKIHGLRHSFQFAMPGQKAWDAQFHFDRENLDPKYWGYFQPRPFEMLYDVQADPMETNNLANDPEYRNKLLELREQVNDHLVKTWDLGLFPRSVRETWVKDGGNLYENIRNTNYPLKELLNLADLASNKDMVSPEKLEPYLTHKDTTFRFWAASGYAFIYCNGSKTPVPPTLKALLSDPCMEVAATAAEALVYAGNEKEGVDALITMSMDKNFAAASALEEVLYTAQANKKQIDRIHEIHAKNYLEYEGGFSIRSILVNLKEISIDSIYTKEEEKNFIQNHRSRIKNWHQYNADDIVPAD